jgi:hypothetical protein
MFPGVSWWPFQGANASSNRTASIPLDSKANAKVKQGILTPAKWQKFANSHCNVVFSNARGLPYYSLATAQNKQGATNFYDIGNPGVGNLTVLQVTGGEYGTARTLTQYLGGATAATANMGYSKQTAIVLKTGYFQQQFPQFTLMHEILLHANTGQSDDFIYLNAFFVEQGLWHPVDSTATSYITAWMSADCACTPGKPQTTCAANTAAW